jgi:hypothetical protein
VTRPTCFTRRVVFRRCIDWADIGLRRRKIMACRAVPQSRYHPTNRARPALRTPVAHAGSLRANHVLAHGSMVAVAAPSRQQVRPPSRPPTFGSVSRDWYELAAWRYMIRIVYHGVGSTEFTECPGFRWGC